jgi:hypothetical protein
MSMSIFKIKIELIGNALSEYQHAGIPCRTTSPGKTFKAFAVN